MYLGSQRLAFAWLLVSLLTACGFHLRGHQALDAQWQPVAVEANVSTRELEQVLRARLGRFRQEETAGDAVTEIRLDRETWDRKLLAVDRASGRQEYQLRYLVDYAVENIPSGSKHNERIQLVRSYTFSPGNVLAVETEEQQLLKDLREQAVDEMLRRLQYQSGQR